MKLGRSRLSRKPHFGVFDPLANVWSKNFSLHTKYAKIDESMGYGEIDWTDPVSVQNYLLMPSRVARIEKSIDSFSKSIDIFAEGMKEHMLLIREIRELVQAMRELERKKAFTH